MPHKCLDWDHRIVGWFRLEGAQRSLVQTCSNQAQLWDQTKLLRAWSWNLWGWRLLPGQPAALPACSQCEDFLIWSLIWRSLIWASSCCLSSSCHAPLWRPWPCPFDNLLIGNSQSVLFCRLNKPKFLSIFPLLLRPGIFTQMGRTCPQGLL